MRTLMLITFLFCLGCAGEDVKPQFPGKDYIPEILGLRMQEISVTLDCQQNLFFVSLLKNRNETLTGYLILIKQGVMPDTGCSRLYSCIEVIQKEIALNKFNIQILERACT